MAGSKKEADVHHQNSGHSPHDTDFSRESILILYNTTRELFNCLVTVLPEPVSHTRDTYQIDITQEPDRFIYVIDDNTILITAMVYREAKPAAGIGLLLRKPYIVQLADVITTFAGVLASQLSDILLVQARNALQLLGDDLIKLTIARHLSSQHFNVDHIVYLIDIFNKLRTTSYEGHYFSTGMIVTGSVDVYIHHSSERYGHAFPLLHSVNMLRKGSLNKRFWYLADGKTSFYIADKKLQIVSLFNLDKVQIELNYIDDLTLSHTIKDTDIMIRVDNEKELSIVTPNQQEFIYTENKWSVRDYRYFILLLNKFLGMDSEFTESLLFFVLYCSKNGISAIIWIPREMGEINQFLKSRNRSFRKPIVISEKRDANLVIRLLSSDGVTIIDKQGHLQYYGCIVDLTKAKVRGAKGTGESAAKLLSRNGGSIKISRDGAITLYLPHYSPAILF